jgi:hypothetical protein
MTSSSRGKIKKPPVVEKTSTAGGFFMSGIKGINHYLEILLRYSLTASSLVLFSLNFVVL